MNIVLKKDFEKDKQTLEITSDLGYGISLKLNKRQYQKVNNFLTYLRKTGVKS
jgi:hypothetical protein